MEIHVHTTLAKEQSKKGDPNPDKQRHTYMYITHKKLKIENRIEK